MRNYIVLITFSCHVIQSDSHMLMYNSYILYKSEKATYGISVSWTKRRSIDDKPNPKLQHHQDVILRVTSTALCGSDLHLYHGTVQEWNQDKH